jgi:hypothetical protein
MSAAIPSQSKSAVIAVDRLKALKIGGQEVNMVYSPHKPCSPATHLASVVLVKQQGSIARSLTLITFCHSSVDESSRRKRHQRKLAGDHKLMSSGRFQHCIGGLVVKLAVAM